MPGAPGPVDAAGAARPGGALVALKRRLQEGAHALADPLVGLLARLGARPDHLTIAGLALS